MSKKTSKKSRTVSVPDAVLPGLEAAPVVAAPAKPDRTDAIVKAIVLIGSRIERLEARPVSTGKTRKPSRPKTPAELAFLAKVRDDWFKKMGYGPYKAAKAAPAPVSTEADEDDDAEADSLSDALRSLVG